MMAWLTPVKMVIPKTCNDIPEQCYRSATGQCHDWRIGHGLTDTDAAVALARTLQLCVTKMEMAR